MEVKDKKKRKKALAETGAYTYDPSTNDDYNRYNQSAQQAYTQLDWLKNPSPAYTQQLENIYLQYVQRQPFSYDQESDPLYKAYRNQYVTLGQRAMEDTVGRAAALTGGYSNTYGTSAGQQAYGAYLQQLSELLPELYTIARDNYQAEDERLLTQYDMVSRMGSDAYDRYQDQKNALWKDVAYFQDLAQQAYDRGYENWWDNLQMEQAQEQKEYDRQQDALNWEAAQEQKEYDRQQDALAQQIAAEQKEYDRQQDALAQQIAAEQREYDRQQDALAQKLAAEKLAYDKAQDAANAKAQQDKDAYNRKQDAYDNLEALIAAGYNPSDAELSAAGMTRNQANVLKAYYAAKNAPKSSGSSTTKNTTTTTTTTQKSHQDAWKEVGKTVAVGTPSRDNIKTMQALLGIGVDGVWGAQSTAAAGNRTAAEAWKKFNDGGYAWKTDRAEKYLDQKGTRDQWKARGVTGNEYDAMVTNWLKDCGFLPAEICWLKKQFAK